MIRLTKALDAWGTPDFEDVLKNEITRMKVDQLPLQQGLTASSHALDDNIRAIIIAVSESENFIQVKAGIFYSGIIAGCNCADDPTPVEAQSEYCEVLLDIDKKTAETGITLVAD
ncbi:MAG: hypothetical protein LLG15_03765 [Betaproteobacteria bacterium]|nr:hypothetical protein [Betaproteobacteria bacterium]